MAGRCRRRPFGSRQSDGSRGLAKQSGTAGAPDGNAAVTTSGGVVGVTVYLIDTESHRYTLLADLAVNRTFGMHRDHDGMLRVLGGVRGSNPASQPVMIRLDPVTED